MEGDLALSQDKRDEALKFYRKALDIRNTPILSIKIVNLLKDMKKTDEAYEFLNSWAKSNPQDVTARTMLANWQLQENDNQAAIKLYEELLQDSPNNIIALNNLAYVYQQMGDERAITLAEKAFQLAPLSLNIIDTYAWILIKNGQVQQGLYLLKPVIDENENIDPNILFHYAYGLSESGDIGQAKRHLEIALRNTDYEEYENAIKLREDLNK